jgi:hypothetical protein
LTLDLPIGADRIIISPLDMLELVKYWLQNSDLTGPDDPRRHLIRWAEHVMVVDGHNAGGRRLVYIPSLPIAERAKAEYP